MNKYFLLAVSIIFMSCSAYSLDKVGFQDNTPTKATVVQALKMADDSFITVEGNIIKRISDDKYLFKDATGTLTVEIDMDKWNGQSVNMTDKLELTGELEKKLNKIKLDVDTVKVITKK